MIKLVSRLAAATMLVAAVTANAATPDQPLQQPQGQPVGEPQIWRVDGGEMRMRFNKDFLDLFGVGVELSAGVLDRKDTQFAVFPLLSTGGLRFNAPGGGFDRFVDGQLRVQGGFELILPGGQRIDLRNAEIKADPQNSLRLQLIGADGQSWVYVDHLMYDFTNQQRTFRMRAADLRASPRLAKQVGMPELANAYIGEIHFDAMVRDRGADSPLQSKGTSVPRFHGEAHPDGGIFEADVLMENYSMSFSRCRRSTQANGCDGSGPDDGEVVFTPSATLRNGDTDRTADVPWYEKFTVSPYPFPYQGNDQHPYLIWNLYRIVDDQLEQIGASGVKHAWLTINSGCRAGNFFNSHILGRRCGDTYGTGNNDDPSDLGPRHELLPATAEWGRCGSVFDPNPPCGSLEVFNPNGSYGSRMVVRESQMLVAGAQFLTDSWYIVQDDINIYNTMGRRSMNPAPGGGGWIVGSQSSMAEGPALNAWVDPAVNPARNVELDSRTFGRARVAVKVKTLDSCPAGSGLTGVCYRYDYAVQNFDFATSQTSGTPPNLTVDGALGFQRFSINIADGTSIFLPTGADFADIDINAGNNWVGTASPTSVSWQAPAGNTLDWGTLYRFSFISTWTPGDSAENMITLTPADTGVNAMALTGAIVGPQGDPNEVMYDGFEGN